MSQAGFIRLPVLIAIILGLGLGASAYLNYHQHERALADAKLMQGQITDLRYQLKQDQSGNSPSPSSTPSTSDSPSPSPSASSQPQVAGAVSIDITQIGAKLTPLDPVLDLTYAPMKSGGLTVAGLTTQSLLAKYPACKPGALGMLFRRPKSQKAPAQDKLIKTLGDFSYYYVPSSTGCATGQAGQTTLAAARAAVVGAVLPTLTN